VCTAAAFQFISQEVNGKLIRSTTVEFLVSSVLFLAANSWAQSRPPIIERIAKTYGLNSWNQVEAIGSEGSKQWPRSLPAFQ
jgi:hypothetical protein